MAVAHARIRYVDSDRTAERIRKLPSLGPWLRLDSRHDKNVRFISGVPTAVQSIVGCRPSYRGKILSLFLIVQFFKLHNGVVSRKI